MAEALQTMRPQQPLGHRRPTGMLSLLLLLSLSVAPGCTSSGAPWAQARPIDSPLADLPTLENPREQDDKIIVRVVNGLLPQLGGHITHLAAGPRTLLVVYAEGGGEEVPPQPIALWLRGRGSSRSRLPQFTSGLVNPGNSQDWRVDLSPGDYLLSITLGATGDDQQQAVAHIIAR